MKTLPASELVLDFDLYPRGEVDSTHVGYLVRALESGALLPPIVIDEKSKRVIDGFHRIRAYIRHSGNDAYPVPVVEKHYRSEGAMLLDAISYNSTHGRMLTSCDRTRCLILSDRYKISMDQVASALQMTVEALGKLKVDRIGTMRGPGSLKSRRVPLKRTIRHMRRRALTAAQAEVNKRLGGMNQLFYVNQIIMLIENDLLDKSDKELMVGIQHLGELIKKL